MLRRLPSPTPDDRFLVGNATLDDAAAVRVRDDLAIVQSVDLFTPLVDDPRDFGRIAAANALSDLYAMGAEPLFSLAVAGVPSGLDPEIVTAILAGGAEVAALAGAPVLGGHTITDPEPKYGLAVTGTARPDGLWRNAGARPGDVLVLSKPLGTGVVANALRHDAAPDDVLAAAVTSMTTLNRDAAAALRAVGGPSAATDVTGFGLVGHLREIAAASGVEAHIELRRLPLLPGAYALAAEGHVPGGSARNRRAADAYAVFAPDADPLLAALACDAQTSGGLLAALPPDRPLPAGFTAIGTIVDGTPGRLLVNS